MQQQDVFVRRSTGSTSPVRRQAASLAAAAAVAAGSSAALEAAVGEQQLSDLQQLHSNYAEVIGMFEDLLVSERRGRMEAERDVAQLMQQLRAESRRGKLCM
jgi:hypothetical protein